MNETVSIITPSFNRASLVTETAESILAQTYPHWEWMIVDDGSTDNSWDVLRELARKDSRIKIFQRDREPKGACTCRNTAVEKCTGKYLIFLDTDDLLAPFCLEQRVAAMQQQPDMDFIIFPLLLFHKEVNDVNLLWNIDKEMDDLMRMLINDPVCQGTGTLWKKSTFQEVGMWREDLKIWQDVELHIRSFLWPVKHDKRFDLKPDVYLRMSDDSLSRVGYHAPAKVNSRMQVFNYACKAVAEKGLMNKYKKSLQTMGLEIILSAVFQRQFKAGNETIAIGKKYHLYNQKELRDIRTFLLVHQFKLTKIQSIKSKYFQIVSAIAPKANATVGITPYQNGTATHAARGDDSNSHIALNLVC